MKKRFLPLCLALLVSYCIFFPRQMALSVVDGLELWYHSILPTLLPFCIFSNIIVRTGVYDRFFEALHPLFRIVYPVRAPLIYPLIAGFFFGFPLGSKICADLYKTGRISKREAELVTCVSNNFGPAFLYNYVISGLLGNAVSAWKLFVCFYLPPLLLGRILLFSPGKSRAAVLRRANPCPSESFHVPKKPRCASQKSKNPASESPISLEILDAGIIDGFTTMLKLAGYIFLAAILADILSMLPIADSLLSAILTGTVEITNGIRQLSLLENDVLFKALPAVGIVNFGGVSGMLQTSSMMRGTGFPLRVYIAFKLACGLLGMMLFLIIK